MSILRVLLATSWGEPCGIAEHSAYLKESVEAADPAIVITPSKQALDPAAIEHVQPHYFDVLHLNYHRALHSRWVPGAVRIARKTGFFKAIVITFHDTFGGPPDDLSRELSEEADAFIVHEPCDGLPQAIYWRMGVPAAEEPYHFGIGHPLAWRGQPILGTVGFPFPWKNYEQLCEITAEMGWALLLIAPTATETQIASWRQRQPDLLVQAGFTERREVVSLLSGCDATAFCYTCANSGQSAAVLQGIAARKPVFAFETCRQFRSLALEELPLQTAGSLIRWGETFDDLRSFLRSCPIARVDPRTVALAERDSWAKLGRQYANTYRAVAAIFGAGTAGTVGAAG